ncbi:MAG: AraC family transcriptional regulator [Kiritimatiellia bacterium]
MRFRRHLALYHPPDKNARVWGVRAINVGYTVIPPRTDYPPQHHPDSYLFTWERGRIFSEYQFLAVTQGRGAIETASAGLLELEAGDIFVLFPGEWHRFRPDYACGWNECWVGFDGDYAKHLMQTFFLPFSPVLRGAATPEINRLMQSIIKRYKEVSANAAPLLASDIIALISRLVVFVSKMAPIREQVTLSKIALARSWLSEHASEDIEPQHICDVVGMGYSAFRKAFKEETGYAPHAYVLEIRVNRAKGLLQQTEMTITQIASETGFSSVFYFTRFFKCRTGYAPSDWRKTNGLTDRKTVSLAKQGTRP